MAWAHVQDNPGSNGMTTGSGTSLTFGAFTSAVAINDYVIVWSITYSNVTSVSASNITCSDNATSPNSYSQFGFVQDQVGGSFIQVCIFVAKITSNPSSGNLIPKISSTVSMFVFEGCAAEFSGGNSTVTTDGIGTHDGNSVTQTFTPGAISTTVSGDLVVSCLNLSGGGNPANLSKQVDFTAVGTELNAASFQVGQGAYWITTSTLSNSNESWSTTDAGSQYAACQVALKPVPAVTGVDPLIYFGSPGLAFGFGEDDVPFRSQKNRIATRSKRGIRRSRGGVLYFDRGLVA